MKEEGAFEESNRDRGKTMEWKQEDKKQSKK